MPNITKGSHLDFVRACLQFACLSMQLHASFLQIACSVDWGKSAVAKPTSQQQVLQGQLSEVMLGCRLSRQLQQW